MGGGDGSGGDRLFGTNGVRGVFGDDFTLELVHDLASSIAAWMRGSGRGGGNDTGPILVGYDGRHSGPVIARVVCATLNAHGVHCRTAGLVPTPCLEFATKKLGYAAGIMVTASHNPPRYNGIKLCDGDGVEISRDDERAIEKIYFGRTWPRYAAGSIGTTTDEPAAIDVYLDGISSAVDADAIRSHRFTVALDLGNGAQAAAAPLFCRRLGCRTVTINGDIDGAFPGRGSEPTPQNLSGLSALVCGGNGDGGGDPAETADLGIAFDGDGDRSIFCDELGRIMTGDRSALLLARHILLHKKGGPGEIVTCLNSGTAIEEIARRADSAVTRTKVGSVEVSRHMVASGAVIGFEENGGFMYGAHNPVRDGVMTLGLMLDLLASSGGQTVSQLASTLPPSFTAKDKITCTPDGAQKTISALAREFPDADTTDGVKITLGPREWVMIRPSGTEPIVRVYAEAGSQERLDELMGEYMARIKKSG